MISSIIRYIKIYDYKGVIDIMKTGIKLIAIVITGVSMLFFSNNRNMEDDILKEDIIETRVSHNRKIDEIGDDNISNNLQEQIKNEEIELAAGQIKKIIRSKEEDKETLNDKVDIEDIKDNSNKDIDNLVLDKKQISRSSRGELIDKKGLEVSSKNLNQYVLDVVSTYSLEKGEYPYLLNNDFKNYNGVTEDIYYKDELILKANPAGDRASNCTGISFEVFFKAMQKRNKELGIPVDDFNGMSKDEVFDMALTWFVAKGSKSESNLAVAIEKYGLGSRINNLEDARPGDFIDLSRENNSGHAVVFIDWLRKGEKIIGLKLWSSQGSTNGISYKEEYFNIKDENGKKYGGVRLDNLHIVRVGPVSKYKKY